MKKKMLNYNLDITFILTVLYSNFFFASATSSGDSILMNIQLQVNTNEGIREFTIDYKNNTFLKDGKPFHYVSGSFHYFRCPRAYWQDRLRKMRAAGLNAVSTYIEWSSHEPSPGKFQFTGENDLEHFLELAVKEDLLVLLRPGPYICAERDFGGFPPWLLTIKPDIKLRTNDVVYQTYVKKWFDVLFPRIEKYLYGNGGPIIMVQVENEYGSYACNKDHMSWLRDLMEDYVGDKALLYSTDGNGLGFLKCVVPRVYATVDFGAGDPTKADEYVSKAFTAMRNVTPHGPLVNSEFYPGWLTHWNEGQALVGADRVTATLEAMLKIKANVNFYMFFGGTNFGFTAGANTNGMDTSSYSPDITSYDYDAPLTEAGDPTQKYFQIRDVILKYLPKPNIPPPKPSPKAEYGQLSLRPIASIFDKVTQLYPAVKNEGPLCFEALQQNYGFVLYETSSFDINSDPGLLEVPGLRDRGYVFVEEQLVSVLYRSAGMVTVPLSISKGQKLSIFVQNMGRVNYGPLLHDSKGIISDVKFNRKRLTSWTMTQFPLDDISWIETALPTNTTRGPLFYTATFTLPKEHPTPLDAFVDMTNWSKGIVFINNFNLGSYWSTVGPQFSLYLPAPYIKPYPEVNRLTVFELQKAPNDLILKFSSFPIWKNKDKSGLYELKV